MHEIYDSLLQKVNSGDVALLLWEAFRLLTRQVNFLVQRNESRAKFDVPIKVTTIYICIMR